MNLEDIKIGMRVCTQRKDRICPGTVIGVSPNGWIKVKRDNGYVGTPWAESLRPYYGPRGGHDEILEATLEAFSRAEKALTIIENPP